ncbi:hypothetical protein RY27_25710 [Litorilinea aerophila]|nr:hypothetical protein RY27_25710 [Litorilinea aerophila]
MVVGGMTNWFLLPLAATKKMASACLYGEICFYAVAPRPVAIVAFLIISRIEFFIHATQLFPCDAADGKDCPRDVFNGNIMGGDICPMATIAKRTLNECSCMIDNALRIFNHCARNTTIKMLA